MRLPRSFPVPLLALALTALASPARAQDVAAAKALFTQGLTEMEAEHYDKGCPALEESYKLDPRPGTMFTLAECENKRGRLATAVARYEDYLSLYSRLPPDQQKKQADREKTARDQKTALGPLVPTLTLVLPADAPKGTIVTRDGTTLSGPALGLGLPVDPGEHVITTQVPGEAVNEVKITVAKGEKKQVTLEVKKASTPSPAVPPPPEGRPHPVTPPPAAPAGSAGSSKAGESADGGVKVDVKLTPSGRRIGAYVAGGVGVAGLILGGAMGVVTLGKKSVVSKNCGIGGDATGCNDTGLAAASDAKTTGLVSTVGFVVGGVGVAAAVVLLLTEPKKAPAAPAAAAAKGVQASVLSVGREGAMLGLRGAW